MPLVQDRSLDLLPSSPACYSNPPPQPPPSREKICQLKRSIAVDITYSSNPRTNIFPLIESAQIRMQRWQTLDVSPWPSVQEICLCFPIQCRRCQITTTTIFALDFFANIPCLEWKMLNKRRPQRELLSWTLIEFCLPIWRSYTDIIQPYFKDGRHLTYCSHFVVCRHHFLNGNLFSYLGVRSISRFQIALEWPWIGVEPLGSESVGVGVRVWTSAFIWSELPWQPTVVLDGWWLHYEIG